MIPVPARHALWQLAKIVWFGALWLTLQAIRLALVLLSWVMTKPIEPPPVNVIRFPRP
jgi:hypothetical protein